MSKPAATDDRLPGWRDYRAVPVVALIAAILAFLGSFAVSTKYQATTSLLVRSNTSYLSSTSTTDQNIPQLGSTDLATALADTQTALTGSRSVAEGVVNKLHLDQADTSRHGVIAVVKGAASDVYHDTRAILTYGSVPKASKYDTAVAAVQQSLMAVQVKSSYVIAIGATWDNPVIAADIANAAADQLVADSQARYATESQHYRDSLKSQLDAAAKAQTDAQQSLSSYEAAHGISDLDRQLQLTAENAASLQQQVTSLNAQLKNLTAELSSVQASLSKTSSTSTNSQKVQTGRSSTDITSTAPNTLYQSLATQAATLRAQIDGVTAQRDSINTALSNTPTQTTPLTDTQAESSRLALLSTVASSNYQALSQQYQQAVLAGNQSSIEVSRIDTATPPTLPVSPIRYMYLLIGLVIGALLSFVLAHTRVLRRARRAAGRHAGTDADADDTRRSDDARRTSIDLSRFDHADGLVRQPTHSSSNGHAAAVVADGDAHDQAGE